MHSKTTIDTYLERLAAKSPVPGGGSAAAFVGALGMALISMVGRYSEKKYKNSSAPVIRKIVEFSESARQRLMTLMQEDEKAYLRLSKILWQRRSKDRARFYVDAARVPLEVCYILQDGLVQCKRLLKYCKSSLISDIGVAALILEAGFSAAKLNVEINLPGIKDRNYSEKIRQMLQIQRQLAYKTRNDISRKVEASIS